MRYAMLVNSRSGNTKMLADAIEIALKTDGAECVCAMDIADDVCSAALTDETERVLAADAVLVGFWCDKGTCSTSVAELLKRLAGKRVFLFGTCGFGGSEEYFQQIIDRVAAALPESAKLVGSFMCQGKMGPGVRARYEAVLAENPDDPRAQAMIRNFDAAIAHPDTSDLTAAAASVIAAVGL